jgi:methionine synthase II (cobalamin-independent)
MAEKSPDFGFMATGIGSVPFLEVDATCREIIHFFPLMPFWPQFVKRSYLEDMSVQYSEGLPLLSVNREKRSLTVSKSGERESELVNFYERFFSEDLDSFAMSEAYAPGLYALMACLNEIKSDQTHYIKGQTVGPITFTSGILGLDGRPVIHDPDLSEAFVRGLAIKALWQVRMLEKSGRRPVIFLDEPSLSGFGSAFSSIQRQDVVDKLQMMISYLKDNSDCLVGIHCCGNTDWSMILAARPDIINFDAFEFLEHFLLYPDGIAGFLREGGTIAWGIVPTSGFTGHETEKDLLKKVVVGIEKIGENGLSPQTIVERSIFTPSCGMGSMDPANARSAMSLLARLQVEFIEGSFKIL